MALSTVEKSLERIQNQIRQSALKSGRSPDAVRVVAVTKGVPVERIQEALRAGIFAVGENKVQEAAQKLSSKTQVPAEWHFIGHLQTNKAKAAVRIFDVIESLDSLDLAERLDRAALEAGKVQKCLLQIKVSDEPSKFGWNPEALNESLGSLGALKNLEIVGLMCMAPHSDDPEKARPYFQKAAQHFGWIQSQKVPGIKMNELSMGMSHDFSVAVEEGATIVRIGTALFGERPAL